MAVHDPLPIQAQPRPARARRSDLYLLMGALATATGSDLDIDQHPIKTFGSRRPVWRYRLRRDGHPVTDFLPPRELWHTLAGAFWAVDSGLRAKRVRLTDDYYDEDAMADDEIWTSANPRVVRERVYPQFETCFTAIKGDGRRKWLVPWATTETVSDPRLDAVEVDRLLFRRIRRARLHSRQDPEIKQRSREADVQLGRFRGAVARAVAQGDDSDITYSADTTYNPKKPKRRRRPKPKPVVFGPTLPVAPAPSDLGMTAYELALAARQAGLAKPLRPGPAPKPVRAKSCRDCGQTKPLDDFYSDDTNKDGLMGECKICYHAALAARI